MANISEFYALPEVAGLLGKNLRQVRYAVRSGQIPAQKVGGRWMVKKSDIAVQPTAAQAAAVERVEAARSGRRYSVRDLRAFQVGEGIYRAFVETFSVDHPIALRLRAALEAITLGCHAFEAEEKVEHFRNARRGLATALADLLVAPSPPTETEMSFAERIEGDLMPQLGGLIRAADKKPSGHRFRSFGARR